MKTLASMNPSLDIVGAIVDGKLREMNFEVEGSETIEWIDKDSHDGKQIYERSLILLLIYTCKQLFPKANVRVEHSLQGGLYCTVHKETALTPLEVVTIKQQMETNVALDLPIIRHKYTREEAIKHFEKEGMHDKAALIQVRHKELYALYQIGDYEDYFFGLMVPSTKYIQELSLQFFAPGVRLGRQSVEFNQYQLLHCMQAYERWGEMIHISNLSSLNACVKQGRLKELMLMSEAMIDKRLSELASQISDHRNDIRMILIAGPSSAGKTTFSYRLAIHLKILGIEPVNLSMDDFYVDREKTPKLPDGSYDFESIEAVDLELFNKTVLSLIHQEAVHLPRFDFKSGKRYYDSYQTTLQKNQVLIIEGIHGLNPRTSYYIPKQAKFKIYINALTHLNFDDHHRFSTSDYRLIRRMVRDYQFRNCNADKTILQWPKVKDGENRYIYPYQEEADFIFNTSMLYELPVLKPIAKKLLDEVGKDSPVYLEANRLDKLLDYIIGADIEIPSNSLLAEFIGHSIFTDMSYTLSDEG